MVTVKWILRNRLRESEVDGTGQGSCPMADFCISGVKPTDLIPESLLN
jgi:hypothetical protein